MFIQIFNIIFYLKIAAVFNNRFTWILIKNKHIIDNYLWNDTFEPLY